MLLSPKQVRQKWLSMLSEQQQEGSTTNGHLHSAPLTVFLNSVQKEKNNLRLLMAKYPHGVYLFWGFFGCILRRIGSNDIQDLSV